MLHEKFLCLKKLCIMEERKSLVQYEKFDESIKRLKEDILLQILVALQYQS